ncbi:hypothetical protein Phum_PHUM580360 [Pediculus humanus corporis]|uniref:F-box domain-containing protein n=1 Tax=Pediculus humanus subsp. corporis TaxID=121224 RepID=E0W1X3_PEDHC|nr:uncharacterized protein Phum_PHUM580360 [Pediculus humanus corporis]EEB19567.1 hypothetical protein Phum_PHUM580360 [Pediculus humanus corporis]
MEPFLTLFYTMGVSTMFFDMWNDNFDIIGNLPLEIASMILRKLDPKTLLTACKVSNKWLKIIKSDCVLRKTIREEILRQRREKWAKEMFLSKYINHHAGVLNQPKSSTTENRPYPDLSKKSGSRRFEKSIKTVEQQVPKNKKMKKTWVSTVSTGKIRNFR